ncbi:MAG: hypothetical protein KGN79_10455 [Acidobacteriota bacterium]|nr:hypothetical protein [Acidobacteriota bacterium]
MRRFIALVAAFIAFTAPALAQTWQSRLDSDLPLLGHRNWILIVDSAYPDQVGPGIETVETDANMLPVLKTVLSRIQSSIHVRPVIFLDAELPYVPDSEAPGAKDFRNQLESLLGSADVHHRLHQSLIDEVAKDSQQYHILILKTRLAIPYTSIFINLRAKYWSDDDERGLRDAMSNVHPR